jgi:uncharacterized membrane protein YjdF
LIKYKSMMVSITAFFMVAQILLMLGLAEKGYMDYVHSVAVTTGFWVVYTFLEVKYKLYMNNYVRAVMVLTLLSDGFFGYYLNLYATSFVFDKFLHIFGTYAFSLFAYNLIVQLLNNPVKLSFKFLLVICLGLSIGAFYEILEFITDTISHPMPPSQPSLLDTDLDLIGDLIGAVFAAIHAASRTFMDENF